jgi:hypothetical protein
METLLLLLLFDKIFSRTQPCQGVEVLRRFRDCVPIFRVTLMAGKTKADDLVTCYAYCILGHQFVRFGFTSHQHHPEDGDAVREILENFQTSTRLSARLHFIEFCRRERLRHY